MRTITRQTDDRIGRKFNGWPRNAAFTRGLWSVALAVLVGPLGAFAAPLQNVTLAWNPSSGSQVTGYRIYYGIASGSYTNSVAVGNVTTGTISNLIDGVTYFFATKAYSATGLESAFSNEVLFVPGGAATLRLTITANKQAVLTLNGKNGHTYEIQSSVNLTSWNVIGSVTVGSSGTANFTDTSAPSYTKRFYRTRDTTP